MNQQQLLDWLKSTIVLIGSAAATHGIGNSDWWSATAGVAVTVAPFVWGWIRNTLENRIKRAETLPDAAKVAIAANVPGVSQVLLKPTVSNGLAEAAADPGLPKVSIAPPFAVTPR